jgi:hypothetical protein
MRRGVALEPHPHMRYPWAPQANAGQRRSLAPPRGAQTAQLPHSRSW